MSGISASTLFEIAKRFTAVPAESSGLNLRRLTAEKAGAEASMLVRAGDYEDLRSNLARFCSERGASLAARGRSKSLEISARDTEGSAGSAFEDLLAFAGTLPFVSEDVLDFFLFYSRHIGQDASDCVWAGAESPIRESIVTAVHAAPDVGRIVFQVPSADTDAIEQVFAHLMPVLHRYDMGLFHQSPEKE